MSFLEVHPFLGNTSWVRLPQYLHVFMFFLLNSKMRLVNLMHYLFSIGSSFLLKGLGKTG